MRRIALLLLLNPVLVLAQASGLPAEVAARETGDADTLAAAKAYADTLLTGLKRPQVLSVPGSGFKVGGEGEECHSFAHSFASNYCVVPVLGYVGALRGLELPVGAQLRSIRCSVKLGEEVASPTHGPPAGVRLQVLKQTFPDSLVVEAGSDEIETPELGSPIVFEITTFSDDVVADDSWWSLQLTAWGDITTDPEYNLNVYGCRVDYQMP